MKIKIGFRFKDCFSIDKSLGSHSAFPSTKKAHPPWKQGEKNFFISIEETWIKQLKGEVNLAASRFLYF